MLTALLRFVGVRPAAAETFARESSPEPAPAAADHLAGDAGMKAWRSLLCLFGIHAVLTKTIYSSWDGTQVHERYCARCGKVLGHILN
jgi:hypothetical protein